MDILYADTNVLVVNKPSGLATVPGSWDEESTSLVKALEGEYGRLWVVHRLDKVTSGLVILALNPQAHRQLSMQFEHHETHKLYHAVVAGVPAWEEHTARHPLRINVGHSHRTTVDNDKGKPSETAFQVIERFNGYALISATPATGRTHQVRVHFAALGCPILGDATYGRSPRDLAVREIAHTLGRQALHARALGFFHPKTGAWLEFQSEPPADFSAALDSLRVLAAEDRAKADARDRARSRKGG